MQYDKLTFGARFVTIAPALKYGMAYLIMLERSCCGKENSSKPIILV